MATDTSQIGSVGHLIGASLETAGQFLQSILLDAFTTTDLGRALGVLLFVITALTAIYMGVFQGHPRSALGFLIGPTIFFFLIFNRTASTGAQWQYGARTYTQDPIKYAAVSVLTTEPVGVVGGAAPVARVSWFFATWNRIVSSGVQSFLSALDYISKNGDLSLLSKAERYNQLFSPAIEDASVRGFISSVLVPYCSDYLLNIKELYHPGVDGVRKGDLQDAVDKRGKATAITRQDNPTTFTWLEDQGLLTDPALANAENLTCEDIWKLGISALLPESAKFIEALAHENRPEGISADDVRKQLQDKFNTTINYPDGSIQYSLNDDQRLLLMINEVAGRMMLRELRNNHPIAVQAEFGPEIPFNEGGLVTTKTEGAAALRRMLKVDEGEEKGDFLMAMLSLPYVQGMVLYFLAFTFPFFALACVVPGRTPAIFTWMGLWLWIKLWDVGFGVVTIIDGIIYQLLPHGPPITTEVLNQPWEAIKSLMEVDPTYSIYVYYHILAVSLAAVPLLTGMLVRKHGADIMDLVSNKLTTFSGRIGGAMAAYSQSHFTQTQGAIQAKYAHDAVQKAMSNARFDPVVRASKDRAAMAFAESKVLEGVNPGLAALSAVKGEQELGIMRARIAQLGSNAVYNSITSQASANLSYKSVQELFNSHDLMNRNFNGQQQLDFEKSMYYMPVDKAADPLLTGGIQTLSQFIPRAQGQAGLSSVDYLLRTGSNMSNVQWIGEYLEKQGYNPDAVPADMRKAAENGKGAK